MLVFFDPDELFHPLNFASDFCRNSQCLHTQLVGSKPTSLAFLIAFAEIPLSPALLDSIVASRMRLYSTEVSPLPLLNTYEPIHH
jgi:hypothetical protein